MQQVQVQSEHLRAQNIQLEQHAMMHKLDKLGSGGENLGSGEKLARVPSAHKGGQETPPILTPSASQTNLFSPEPGYNTPQGHYIQGHDI
jgi:hypothetical protein